MLGASCHSSEVLLQPLAEGAEAALRSGWQFNNCLPVTGGWVHWGKYQSTESRTISITILVLLQEVLCLYNPWILVHIIYLLSTIFQTSLTDTIFSHLAVWLFSEKCCWVAGLSELGHLYLLDCNEDRGLWFSQAWPPVTLEFTTLREQNK